MTPDSDLWDAVVVGAGVAGGCIAAVLADRGWRVLLVEKSVWPRATVCGGCLSATTLDTFKEMGMQSVASAAAVTRGVVWQAGDQSFEHSIPQGASVLRENLDSDIVAHAVRRGVDFRPACSASLLPALPGGSFRSLKLQTNRTTVEVFARLVIACDGIAGTLLKDEAWAKWTVARSTFIGVAATYPGGEHAVEPGRIHMCMGKSGYVGIVRIDDSTEHLAAALDPVACRNGGGPVNVIGDILRSCHRSVPDSLASARLQGTGKLTRHRKQLGGHRVLCVGDACGYVEPVTGEGMAWAALGARELNRLLPATMQEWNDDLPQRWRDHYTRVIGRQQRWCRAMRTTIHHPSVTAVGIVLGNAFPGVARRIAQMICEPKKKDVLNDSIGHVTDAKTARRPASENPRHRHREPAGGAAEIVT